MASLVKCWIILSAVLNATGWLLSGLGQLNGRAYAVVLAGVAAGWIVVLRRQRSKAGVPWLNVARPWKHRVRRPIAALYLVMLSLSFVGGAIHDPIHYDSLSYRVPRVLHWLAEGRWHWIHSSDMRLNVVACGTEWLWAPLLTVVQTERWLFLFNVVSFALLPGLVFCTLIRLGVRPRVAWWWMWLLPSGYCYAMQAGSLATDAYATVYALACIHYALRGRATRSVQDLWLSLLAAALLTATKQTNLPLLALWMVPFALGAPLLLRRPLGTAAVAVWAVFASCLPTLYFNVQHTGTWKGFSSNLNIEPESPVWGIIGNAFAITAQNLLPPVFPFAAQWNQAMQTLLSTSWGNHLKGFEEFGHLQRAPSEQNAGIGFAVCILLAITLWAVRRPRATAVSGSMDGVPQGVRLWLIHGPWLLLLVFMAKIGIAQNARYLAAYYPFLLAVFLSRKGLDVLVRKRWWQGAALVSVLSTVGLLVLSRQRPLWPADWATRNLQAFFPRANAIEKVRNAYAFAGQIRGSMIPILERIPVGEKVIGYATLGGSSEVALWRPFGSRKVVRVGAADTPQVLRGQGLRYVVVEPSALKAAGLDRMEDWAARFQGEIVASTVQKLMPDEPPQEIVLVRLLPTQGSPSKSLSARRD